MTPRAHLALRLCGLVLLLAASVWPSARVQRQRRASAAMAGATHLAVTTAARLSTPDGPRPRAVRDSDETFEPIDSVAAALAPTN